MRNEYEWELLDLETDYRGVRIISVAGFDGDNGVELLYEIERYDSVNDEMRDGVLDNSSLWRVTVDNSHDDKYEVAVYNRIDGQEISGELPIFLQKSANSVSTFLNAKWIEVPRLPWTVFVEQ